MDCSSELKEALELWFSLVWVHGAERIVKFRLSPLL